MSRERRQELVDLQHPTLSVPTVECIRVVPTRCMPGIRSVKKFGTIRGHIREKQRLGLTPQGHLCLIRGGESGI